MNVVENLVDHEREPLRYDEFLEQTPGNQLQAVSRLVIAEVVLLVKLRDECAPSRWT